MLKKWLLIGGDRRVLEMEKLLRQDGYPVDTLGLHEGDEQVADAANAQAVLFAYPFSVRDGCVPTMTGLTIHPDDILEKLAPDTLILAGRGMTEKMAHPCRLKFYWEDERLESRNAHLSAEAAVCEAMQRTDFALMDQTVLVTGYGRFARALASRLHALGAEVWIAARREEQRLAAADDGLYAVSLEEMHRVLPRVHMVLNTVPAQVMGERELQALSQGTWLLELASAPYGFDRKRAMEMGLRCDVLPALPARYAPASAGMALKNAAIRLIQEAEA